MMAVSRLHLLPESYLVGLIDVKRAAAFYPTFLLGKVYAHGQWDYFPYVILIKTTLGLLLLMVLGAFATVTGKLKKRRELFYSLAPPVLYLAVAMMSGMNIGVRHLLPMYAFVIIFAAAGTVTLGGRSRRWAVACAVLIAASIVSSLLVFPNEIAYANEAWGGPQNVHNLLSDANVDWAQQLYQVKQWQDRHPRSGVLVRVFRAARDRSGRVRNSLSRAAHHRHAVARKRGYHSSLDHGSRRDQRRRPERV